jgi:hypothetical protein
MNIASIRCWICCRITRGDEDVLGHNYRAGLAIETCFGQKASWRGISLVLMPDLTLHVAALSLVITVHSKLYRLYSSFINPETPHPEDFNS